MPMASGAGVEAEPAGQPLMLSEEEAAKWKPIDLEHWADGIAPSPIERGDRGKDRPEVVKKYKKA
jgi:hypothetical protein